VRSPLIVVRCVLLQDEPKVPLVDDDEVVQTLTPQGADQTLGDGVRLGCPDGGQQRLDAEPGGVRDEATTVAAVAVPDEIAGLLAPGSGRDQLAPNPLGRGMGGHVEMHQPSASMGDKKEHVQRVQADGRDGEEVGRPDVRGVVAEEGPPGLR